MNTESPKKILVTGANGFMGKALMKHYRTIGIPVVGIDLNSNDSDVIEGNIAEPSEWEHVLDECDVIIHTAALVSNAMDDKDMWKVNVLATKQLLDVAEKRKVRRFVHISSIVAYGNAATGELDETTPVHAHGGSYVLTKLASENVVLAHHAQGKIEAVIIRPSDVYGPGCRVWVTLPIEMIRKQQFALPASGKGYFRPIYIDDLVNGITLAASSKKAAGEIFNVSCTGYVSTKEFFGYHHRWLKRKGPLLLPTKVAIALAETVFRIGMLFGIRSEGSAASVKQLTTQSWFSNQKAKSLLGWEPTTTLDEGMKLTETWLKEQGVL